MKVNLSEDRHSANQVVDQNIDPGSVLFTDQATGYVDLKNLVDVHVSFKSDFEGNNELKWVHIALPTQKNLARNLPCHQKKIPAVLPGRVLF